MVNFGIRITYKHSKYQIEITYVYHLKLCTSLGKLKKQSFGELDIIL